MQFYAQNEQNFNAVERILYYTDLPSEGDYTKPDDPAPSWPEKGEIQFKDVDLAYREGLPLVLKGVSFSVRPGEKVRNHCWSYERAALTRVTRRLALLVVQGLGRARSCKRCSGVYALTYR